MPRADETRLTDAAEDSGDRRWGRWQARGRVHDRRRRRRQWQAGGFAVLSAAVWLVWTFRT